MVLDILLLLVTVVLPVTMSFMHDNYKVILLLEDRLVSLTSKMYACLGLEMLSSAL